MAARGHSASSSRAGGGLSKPEMLRPSKLFQRTMRWSAKRAVSTPAGATGCVHG